MAKERRRPADRFTAEEAALGAGIPLRGFRLLQSNGLMIEPAPKWGGLDPDVVAHAALVGAIHAAGAELIAAGRVAKVISDELCAAYGGLPANLEPYLNGSDAPKVSLKNPDSSDFWLHREIVTACPTYRRGAAMLGDFVIDIVDRNYIFMTTLHDRERPLPGEPVSSRPEPALRIVDWGRGVDASVVPIHEEAGGDRDLWRAIHEEFERAWLNATASIRLNLSLAIRRSFDAIHDHRLDAGAPIDWTATARPPPSRYDGCDAQGRPLDINHHFYQGLSPIERARRLLEIEEYLAARERG